MSKRGARDVVLRRATASLDRGIDSAAQATAVANDIYQLVHVLELADDAEVEAIFARWNALVQTRFPDLVATRAEYLIRLARSGGQLLFEEMAKLISLGEDLHVLEALGLATPAELLAECAQALSERIVGQREIATVASSLVRPWSRGFWCYKLLLG